MMIAASRQVTFSAMSASLQCTSGRSRCACPRSPRGTVLVQRDIDYRLVRVIIGYILLMHGWAKVIGAGVAGVCA